MQGYENIFEHFLELLRLQIFYFDLKYELDTNEIEIAILLALLYRKIKQKKN